MCTLLQFISFKTVVNSLGEQNTELSIFVRYYPNKNKKCQLSVDKNFFVRVHPLMGTKCSDGRNPGKDLQAWFGGRKKINMHHRFYFHFFYIDKVANKWSEKYWISRQYIVDHDWSIWIRFCFYHHHHHRHFIKT